MTPRPVPGLQFTPEPPGGRLPPRRPATARQTPTRPAHYERRPQVRRARARVVLCAAMPTFCRGTNRGP